MSRKHSVSLAPYLLLTVFYLALSPAPSEAQSTLGESDGVLAAVHDGRGSVQFRYRLEFVDQDGFEDEAWASTLRTGIRYLTRQYRRVDLFLEATNVANIGNDAYNSTDNGKDSYPTVADPSLSRMNQAFVRWSPSHGAIRIGRQELVYGNERFVGNVGWRQNHQTFDAFQGEWVPLDWLTTRYTFVDRVHRINGTRNDLYGHLVNFDLDAGAYGDAGIYAYLLDFSDDDDYGSSTNTFGGFWSGHYAIGSEDWSIDWRGEFAVQQDAYDNPNDVSADYTHVVGGIGREVIGVQCGWERLSGSADDGSFATTFATGHKFNGWADAFLATPANGLRDLYVTLSGKWTRTSYTATWHGFTSDSGSLDYGSEIDALLSYTTTWEQTIALKATLYSADDFGTDTNKIWGYTTFAF